MSKHTMNKLRDMLCRELDEMVGRGKISGGQDLEMIHKLTDTIKNVDKINCLEEGNGYSNDGEWNAMGTYSRNNSYDDGMYSRRNSYGMYSGRGYSRAEDGKAMMSDRINQMMEESYLNSEEKNTLRKALEILKN